MKFSIHFSDSPKKASGWQQIIFLFGTESGEPVKEQPYPIDLSTNEYQRKHSKSYCMSWDKPYSRHPDRQTCGRRRRQYPWRPIYCSKVERYTATFGIKLKKWAGNNYEDGDEENKDLTFKKGEEPYGQELGL